jgi:hypothetical protein
LRSRARVDRIRVRLLQEECDLERAPPGRRERRQDFVEDVLEQIAETCVSEAALGLGRSRREHTQSQRARMLDACEPETRLPDPRLALDHERSRPSPLVVDEGEERGELLLSGN